MPGKPRVVVAAGGTAGHVVPAMAVADELRASGAEVSFLGTRERIEAELVPAAGYEIDFVKVRGIDRRNPLRAAARRGSRRCGAVGAAREALRRRGADVVMGGGGFVAGPAGLAAVADRDAAGPDRGRQPPRASPTGCSPGGRGASASPSRSRAARASATWSPAGRCPTAVLEADRDAARRSASGSPRTARCLLVVGGSQGARSINFAAIEAFAEREGRDFHVLHLAGRRDYEELERAPRRAPRTPSATRCSPTSPTSATASPPATSSSAAPAARSSRSPPPAARRSSSPTRTRPPTTRAPTPTGWRRRGRRS